MPKNVRNFWVETSVDGRSTKDGTGPLGKDGGFETTVKIREHGSVRTAFKVSGWSTGTGDLVIEIEPHTVFEHTDAGRIRIKTIR